MINSFGLLNMFQGIAIMIGPPIAGLLYDISKSYASSFVFAGLALVLSGVMCYFISCLKVKAPK